MNILVGFILIFILTLLSSSWTTTYYLSSFLFNFLIFYNLCLQILFSNVKTGLSMEKKCSCDFILTLFTRFVVLFFIFFICIIYPRLRNDRGLVLLQFLLCECNSFYVEVYVLWTSKVNLLFILELNARKKWYNFYGRFKVGLFYTVFVSTKVKFWFRCCLFAPWSLDGWKI